MAIDKGVKVGKYVIKSKIAEGGMGAIYKAKHPTLNRDIILKRLTLRKSSSVTQRFKREAQLMIDFRDDRIVQVYDHFKEGRSYYIAMEYVDGISLYDLIKKKRYIRDDIAILIFSEICKALKYAHDKGVIHRDIKPANILISKSGEIKLTDFGIATSTEDDVQGEGLTTDGMTLGTPAYMSPEQIENTKNVDKRADIYSLGVVLYEMVTGKCPFPGTFTPEALSLIQKGDYLPPKRINPRISPAVSKVVKRAMHHKRKKRYRDLRYVLAILNRYTKKYKAQCDIDKTIQDYLQGDDIDKDSKAGVSGKETVKRISDSLILLITSNIARFATVGFIIAALIVGGGTYGYFKGLHYEYLMSDKYGAFEIVINEVRKDKSLEDHYIYTILLKRGRRGYKIVKDTDFSFNPDPVKRSKRYYYLKSKKIYMESGNYRLRVNVDNELYQKDFFLEPRSIQKTRKKTLDGRAINLNHKAIKSLPLRIYYSVKDVDSKRDITNRIDCYVFYNRWKRVRDLMSSDTLRTGRTYKFKLESKEHYSKFFTIYVKPYQTILTIETDMVPVPGSIYYKSNVSGIDVLLNNSAVYTLGGSSRKQKTINPARTKYQRLKLTPGLYYVTAKRSDGISRTVKTSVRSNESIRIKIKYSKKKNKIDIDVK